MPSTMKSLGIDRLPVDAQLDLIEEIWDSIASQVEALPLTPAQEAEIARCLDDHEANPDDVVPWETIRGEVGDRLENDPIFLHRVGSARKSIQDGRGMKLEDLNN
jgi:putative addiction module component (TIGR02574 family)